jgi:pimeloyl-ACP methyl ester carboxylesterase
VPDPEHGDYSARRLGEDVVAVIDALKLDRPVLAGHSIAGEELSAVANRHPEKISGLVYLDAGYAYAYYTPGGLLPAGVNLLLSAEALRQDMAILYSGPTEAGLRQLGSDLSSMQADIAAAQPVLAAMKAPVQAAPRTLNDRLASAVTLGAEKFTAIPGPVLAFFAVQPKVPADAPAPQRAQLLMQGALQERQAAAFAAGLPNARVVRLPGAVHRIWLSDEAAVVREMNAFMANLK